MAFKTKKSIFWALLTLVLVVGAGGLAFAKIREHNLAENIKERRVCYPLVKTSANPDDGSDPEFTTGLDGAVFVQSVEDVGNGTADFTATSTLGAMPYPAKLWYVMSDNVGSDNTLSCSTLKISGIDHMGRYRSESHTDLDETVAKTTYTYSKVTKVAITDCASGSDANDRISIFASAEIGLGTDVQSWTDVESLCLMDGGAAIRCAVHDGTGNDIRSQVDVVDDTVDPTANNLFAGSAELSTTVADGVCIGVRSSKR